MGTIPPATDVRQEAAEARIRTVLSGLERLREGDARYDDPAVIRALGLSLIRASYELEEATG